MPDCLSFSQGQRVVAPSEPQLGLGVITECSGRRITVLFPKADMSRTYSTDTQAVIRFRVKVGDTLTTADGEEHNVRGVEERKGLLFYVTAEGEEISEIRLSVDLKHSDPLSGLTVGKPGAPADFVARRRAYSLRSLGRAQEHRGLGAARVELLPHQLYVAERVSKMWRPRVLLADEVGLGKTIEGGLIGVRLSALGRASSVAVVAPRALVGQWLAEFYRRFARPLTLFDPDNEEFPQDLLIAADDLDFLPAGFGRDLLIVDEAHHFFKSDALKELTQRCVAVLFLTATPSLGGEDSLISLLHQLDPIRYPSSTSLKEKNEEWAQVAQLARDIEQGEEPKAIASRLEKLFSSEEDLVQLARDGDKEELLQRLVDRHGLGRSLIRNRRARLQSLFSTRQVQPHHVSADGLDDFLVEELTRFRDEGLKVLVMVDSTVEVTRLWNMLKERTSLLVARFDENMSLLERDRQAAWFNRVGSAPAEEDPATVLLCSEIGGEGRNFQVAHHLFLLGLPRHPDKLEQRIGRLDRIGQTARVNVHVPLTDGVTKVRFAWLHEGLDSFSRPLTEGQIAFEKFHDQLLAYESSPPDDAELKAWSDQVREWADVAQERAEQNVDPLIDRMSFDELKANELKREVQVEQEAMSAQLAELLPELLDSLGIMLEPRGDDGLFFVRPGDMMFVEALPGMPPEGALVTFDRALANKRDDVEFLHFEHRLVQNSLDLILEEGVGRATAARWKGAPRTTVLFQFLYILEAEGPLRLSLARFLPVQTALLTGDLSGAVEVGNVIPNDGPVQERELERLAPEVVETLLTRTVELRPRLKEETQSLLSDLAAQSLAQAEQKALEFFATEEARLAHLEESEELKELVQAAQLELTSQKSETLDCLRGADWRFDGVRMILCQE
jgi:ATP-dependent helicase HepA